MRAASSIRLLRWASVIKFIVLTLVPLTFVSYPTDAQAICILWCKAGQRAGRDAARELADAIKDINVDANIGLEDRDIEAVFDRTEGLVGLASLQGQVLISHGGKEYRKSLSHSIDELTAYTNTLDSIMAERIGQVDQASEERIRQILDGIEKETLTISAEMTKQIFAIDEAVKSSSSHISDELQEVTQTASGELAELLGITRAEVETLLNSSEEKLLNILSETGDEVAEVARVVSEETQKNIALMGDESRKFSIVTLDKFEDVSQSLIQEGSNEIQVILDQFEGTSRVLLADSAGHAIDITDNLSEETQEVIELGAQNLEELASHMADEVLTINDAIKESRLQVIEGGLYFIDRAADLTLAVSSTGIGLLFLFISSYSFTKAFLKYDWPEKYVQRVIVSSCMGSTFIFSFTPFIFSIPSMRARVLIPMAQAQQFSEVVPGVGKRIPREFESEVNEEQPYYLTSSTVTEVDTEVPDQLNSEPKQNQENPNLNESNSGDEQLDNPEVDTSTSTKVDVQEAVSEAVPLPPLPTPQSREAAVSKKLDISAQEMNRLNLNEADILRINELTDFSFHLNYPELNGQPLRGDDLGLMIEWKEMRKCRVLVDYLFHRRHPELNGRSIRGDEQALAKEWEDIQDSLDSCE